MSWKSWFAVASQQLPHLLCGAGPQWIALHLPRRLRVSEDGFILIYRDQMTMPCLWAPIRAKQLSMAATVGVIWPYACVRYWPGRRLMYVCPLLVCLNLKTTFFRWRSQKLSGGLGWFCCVCFFVFLITSVKFLYLYSLACYCSIDHLYTLLPPRPQWCNFWGKWI